MLTLSALPSLRDSIRQPLHVFEGEDALLTCVVRNIESNTLLWKREDRDRGAPRILTAGESRVSSDARFNVLHDSGKMNSIETLYDVLYVTHLFVLHIFSSNSSWLCSVRYDH